MLQSGVAVRQRVLCDLGGALISQSECSGEGVLKRYLRNGSLSAAVGPLERLCLHGSLYRRSSLGKFYQREKQRSRPIASKSENVTGEPQKPTFRVLKLRKQAELEADRSKLDTADDAAFYEHPRFVYHTDDSFTEHLTALYRQKLKEGSRVLDLMSSWISHLSEDVSFARVEGHGMNEAELLANKRLDHFWVQDLNTTQALPHEDGSFDAVLISLGIQYLEKPEQVLQEVSRILVPGGQLIVSFSKHSYAEKAVAGWLRRSSEERLAYVSNLLKTAGFGDIETAAPLNEPEKEVPSITDPFYAVCGVKKNDPRRDGQTDASSYQSLALDTLVRVESSSDSEASDSRLMMTWTTAYEMMAKEAVDLGIPKSAIPEPKQPLTRESLGEARDLLSGIIASRMSSNL